MKIFRKIIFFILFLLNTLKTQRTNEIAEKKVFTSENCNIDNCYPPYGECIKDICLCGVGYTTIESNTNNTKEDYQYCSYAYAYKDNAALFELVLPFGAGHFYAGRYWNAALKFVLFWFLSVNKVLYKKRIKTIPYFEKLLTGLLILFGILYVLDYIGFTFNFYRDGNNMPLI